MSPQAPGGSAAPLRSRRRPATVVLGLSLTVLGAVLASALLPSAPGALERAMPYLAGGLSLLWVGGTLMGFAMGRRPARR